MLWPAERFRFSRVIDHIPLVASALSITQSLAYAAIARGPISSCAFDQRMVAQCECAMHTPVLTHNSVDQSQNLHPRRPYQMCFMIALAIYSRNCT